MTRLPIRQVLGWALTALGAAALFAAWWGVSGTPVTAKQIPYVVSGGLPGIGLLVLAAACFASDDLRRRLDRLGDVERKVEALYRLLTEDDAAPEERAVVAVEGGGSYHRPGCRLVAGKPTAEPVDPAAVTARGLDPCRLCDPPVASVA